MWKIFFFKWFCLLVKVILKCFFIIVCIFLVFIFGGGVIVVIVGLVIVFGFSKGNFKVLIVVWVIFFKWLCWVKIFFNFLVCIILSVVCKVKNKFIGGVKGVVFLVVFLWYLFKLR